MQLLLVVLGVVGARVAREAGVECEEEATKGFKSNRRRETPFGRGRSRGERKETSGTSF